MEENKNLENEIIEEVTEEVAEVVEETIDEAIDEAIEEPVEVTEEIADEAIEEAVEEVAEEPEEIKKGSKTGAIIAVVVAVLVVVLAVVTSLIETNKYNRLGYVDISGKTVQDIADAQGVTLAEFLVQYELPADMPGDTTEAAAYYTIPAGVIAKMNGLDFATLQAMLKLPEGVTEQTPWGDAEGSIRVADYIGGEDKVEDFKAQYGLGEEVTADTPWGEVRNTVDLATKAEREAQEAAAAEAPVETEVLAEDEEVQVEVE